MRSALAIAAALLLGAAVAAQQIPAPRGFVTDTAGVIDAGTRSKIEALAQELQQKTGAEIAVLTVDSTAPLDDFSYAMQVAETWKVGKKGDDSGLLVVVAVKDRKVRVVTGYGVEGVLPDGLVGNIQSREMVPEFRAGRMGEGIWRGVAAMAARIAAERGATLSGVPAPRQPRQPQPVQVPFWVIVLVIVLAMIVMAQMNKRGFRGGRGGGPVIIPGGFGGGRRGGGDFGGFGGGGGGFGGFGGGGFGGGGAGRSW